MAPSVPRSKSHWLLLAAPFAVLGAALVVRLATNPDPRGYGTHEQLGLGTCQFRDWLGAPCPTCGVTTAVSHATRGHLVSAFAAQPLGPLLLASALVAAFAAVRSHRRGVDLGSWYARTGGTLWTIALLLVLGCWLLG